MSGRPVRPSEDIPALEKRIAELEQRVRELEVGEQMEAMQKMVFDMQEAMEQFRAVLECSPHPAPIFLHWKFDTYEGCQRAKATYGRYVLEVVNGASAVVWTIEKGAKALDAGGGYTHIEMGMDEAEAALRRCIQSEKPKE